MVFASLCWPFAEPHIMVTASLDSWIGSPAAKAAPPKPATESKKGAPPSSVPEVAKNESGMQRLMIIGVVLFVLLSIGTLILLRSTSDTNEL